MKNLDIRNEIANSGLKYWQVAEGIGVSDGAFSRLLRHELPDEKKEEIRAAIQQITSERL